MRERDLIYEERATWGKCPVCGAEDGQWCSKHIGVALGRRIDGSMPDGGVHLGRIQKAPNRVRVVAID